MKTSVAITDLTRMQGERVCIAGILRDYTCVRPVLRMGGLMERWLYDQGQIAIRPFAVVEFDLQEHTPDPPHTEDWVIDPFYRVERGVLASGRQRKILQRIEDASVECIFGAEIHYDQGRFVMAGEGHRSLGTIRPKKIEKIYYNSLEDGKWSYRLDFRDQTGAHYQLAVTDLACRTFLDHLRIRERMQPNRAAQWLATTLDRVQVFLRIGLARGWHKHPDRCYLQITGVYSFPDYLDGCCFADFDLSDVAPQASSDEADDLPF